MSRMHYENTYNTGGAIFYQQVMRGNSVFDPDYTGAGRQPTFFDQMAALYNRYTVRASTCKVMPVFNATGNSGITNCYLYPSAIATAPSNYYDATQTPFVVSDLTIANTRRALSRGMTTSQICGVPSVTVTADDTFSSAVTGNPTIDWFWQFGLFAADGATAIAGFAKVDVWYDVEFFDRTQTASS